MAAAKKFSIVFTASARAELDKLKVFERRLIADAVVSGLSHQPFEQNRNRKPLPGVLADFDFCPPLWELRVGILRVFYDGKVDEQVITILAVRRKGSSTTTQEVLS